MLIASIAMAQRWESWGSAYLQLGLNLARFPSGKNLQVARDLQREKQKERGKTAEPSTRGKERKEKGLPMLTHHGCMGRVSNVP